MFMDSCLRIPASDLTQAPRRRFANGGVWLLVALLVALVPVPGWAQSSPQFRTPTLPASPSSPGSVEIAGKITSPSRVLDILQQGQQLEQQRQWADALNLYQQALKADPENNTLRQRRSVARLHYDLERRYADGSFKDTIATTNGPTALQVYTEVLAKIQSYYVDQPDWGRIANFGLTSLEIAIDQPQFAEQNLHGVSSQQVHAAFENTLRQVQQMPATNREQVQVIATTVAQQLEQQVGLPAQATLYEFVCGAISGLDPYSAFMSGNQYSETMSQIEGNFVGLGVELRTHPDNLEIVNVIRGGSAHKGGIVAGDRITQVDQLAVNEIGSERAADLLRGAEGSFVRLTVKRGEKSEAFVLQRLRIEIPSVDQVHIVDPENGIGYIRLTNFQKTTTRDFDAALWDLHRQGMQSLIVDLRGNPGGLLSSSVEIADRFVDQGVIVSTRGRNPIEDFTHQARVDNTWRVPLVVLIDENSASASEIFAAAIRDHRRGTIVGRQSYGKGSVQGIFPLSVTGGGVRLTTAKFYSPHGRGISQVGVGADVTVQQSAKPALEAETTDSDPELRVGIQVARRALAQARSTRQRNVAGR